MADKDDKGHLRLSLDINLPLSIQDVVDSIKEIKGWRFNSDD